MERSWEGLLSHRHAQAVHALLALARLSADRVHLELQQLQALLPVHTHAVVALQQVWQTGSAEPELPGGMVTEAEQVIVTEVLETVTPWTVQMQILPSVALDLDLEVFAWELPKIVPTTSAPCPEQALQEQAPSPVGLVLQA